jgi:hypothetical protein
MLLLRKSVYVDYVTSFNGVSHTELMHKPEGLQIRPQATGKIIIVNVVYTWNSTLSSGNETNLSLQQW